LARLAQNTIHGARKTTGKLVETDSADVKLNETFSDCRDKKGKIIKGGRVLDPDLINVPKATDPDTKDDKIEKESSSRFSSSIFYSSLSNDDENDDSNDEQSNVDSEEDKNNETQNSSEDNASENDENDLQTNVKRFFVRPKVGPIKMAQKKIFCAPALLNPYNNWNNTSKNVGIFFGTIFLLRRAKFCCIIVVLLQLFRYYKSDKASCAPKTLCSHHFHLPNSR
jgi:hypothetical protein